MTRDDARTAYLLARDMDGLDLARVARDALRVATEPMYRPNTMAISNSMLELLTRLTVALRPE